MKRYSISEAARLLKVDRRTLQRWIKDQQIPQPTTQTIANIQIKFWSERDFKKLSEYRTREYWHKRKKNKSNG